MFSSSVFLLGHPSQRRHAWLREEAVCDRSGSRFPLTDRFASASLIRHIHIGLSRRVRSVEYGPKRSTLQRFLGSILRQIHRLETDIQIGRRIVTLDSHGRARVQRTIIRRVILELGWSRVASVIRSVWHVGRDRHRRICRLLIFQLGFPPYSHRINLYTV